MQSHVQVVQGVDAPSSPIRSCYWTRGCRCARLSFQVSQQRAVSPWSFWQVPADHHSPTRLSSAVYYCLRDEKGQRRILEILCGIVNKVEMREHRCRPVCQYWSIYALQWDVPGRIWLSGFYSEDYTISLIVWKGLELDINTQYIPGAITPLYLIP